jgi:hypothetical protein
MSRGSINELSSDDLWEFVNATREYVSIPGVVPRHINFHAFTLGDAERQGFGDPSVMNWHRGYIAEFENYLLRTGRRNLVLPSEWRSEVPISCPF